MITSLCFAESELHDYACVEMKACTMHGREQLEPCLRRMNRSSMLDNQVMQPQIDYQTVGVNNYDAAIRSLGARCARSRLRLFHIILPFEVV